MPDDPLMPIEQAGSRERLRHYRRERRSSAIAIAVIALVLAGIVYGAYVFFSGGR